MTSTLGNMKIPTQVEEGTLEDERGDLVNKLKKMKEQAKVYKTFRNRMSRIIEIAEINKHQNEEWIRSLTFYNDNLDTAIGGQKKSIENIRTEDKELDEASEQLKKDYNVVKFEHISLIGDLEAEIMRKDYID